MMPRIGTISWVDFDKWWFSLGRWREVCVYTWIHTSTYLPFIYIFLSPTSNMTV